MQYEHPDVKKVRERVEKLYGMLEAAIKIGERNLSVVLRLRFAIDRALRLLRIGKVNEAKQILERTKEN